MFSSVPCEIGERRSPSAWAFRSRRRLRANSTDPPRNHQGRIVVGPSGQVGRCHDEDRDIAGCLTRQLVIARCPYAVEVRGSDPLELGEKASKHRDGAEGHAPREQPVVRIQCRRTLLGSSADCLGGTGRWVRHRRGDRPRALLWGPMCASLRRISVSKASCAGCSMIQAMMSSWPPDRRSGRIAGAPSFMQTTLA